MKGKIEEQIEDEKEGVESWLVVSRQWHPAKEPDMEFLRSPRLHFSAFYFHHPHAPTYDPSRTHLLVDSNHTHHK